MSAYREHIENIRKARIARDAAREDLYKGLLQQMAAKKLQKRSERGETTVERETFVGREASSNREAPTGRESDGTPTDRTSANSESGRTSTDRTSDETEASANRESSADRESGRTPTDRISESRTSTDRLSGAETSRTPTGSDAHRAAEANRRAMEPGFASRLKEVYRGAEKNVSAGIAGLFRDRSPQQLIEEWNDDMPIMLFPVRMETKFKTDLPIPELWVRIFPDEIAIITHEKTLSDTEISYGKSYWTSFSGIPEDDEAKKKATWRVVADKFGANRAAWIVQQTKPLNWDQPNGNASTQDLEFPPFDISKPDSWTEAPHSKIMPDRFVLMAYDANDELIHTQTGSQVKDILIVGPAPVQDEEDPSLWRDPATNRIEFGEDYVWVKDFSKAVEGGLGFKVPLNDRTKNGFAKLLAVGLKISADESDGKQLLEDLIDSHHYSTKGFSLLKQGSPTNNTEEEDASFNSKDPMQELSYWVETGKPLFEPTNDPFKKSDGQRMADYLGIDYGPLQYIANSDTKDHAQAVAMNAALSAGTVDYYLSNMLNGVLDAQTRERIRNHFVYNVTGRGPLASIRVGKQPYGILLSSSFPLWKYPQNDRVVMRLLTDNFLPRMLNVLRFLEKEWDKLRPQVARLADGANAGESLMKVLGLHPSSIEYFQRVAFTKDDVENKGLLMNDKYWVDIMNQSFEKSVVRSILQQLGHSEKLPNGALKPIPLLLQLIYQRYHTRLDNKNLIDGNPLSETEGIQPFNKNGDKHFIHWLIEHAADAEKLEKQDFGGAPKPHSMLYLMLYFSLLTETGKSISKFLELHDIAATELVKSRKMMNMSSGPSISPWEIFKTPVNLLVAEEPAGTALYAYLHSPRFNRPEFTGVVSHLKELKAALEVLKEMPTGALERTLAEHIDTLSYRLDSWQTSLFDLRLQQNRNMNASDGEKKQGVYIGSFGYLENVRPNTKRREKINEQILPESLREQKDNLYRELANGGYIQAPSLNHATAAAILRNGYLTYSTKDEKELLSINLSSERVRRAMYLIEGVRNGQTLETLLGYLFERGLHDYSTRNPQPVILNHLIPVFRKNFPIKKTKIPQKGKVTGPEEVIDDFQVVNGLSVIATASGFPMGLPDLPALDPTQLQSIRSVKETISNTIDAFHDVLVSESAYQLAMGNFDRAAALVQSISNSNILPDIEVINTPRGTDLSLTNRVVVHFDPAINTNPWPTIPMTPRAFTEPAMNSWAGGFLGNPDLIRCKVMAVDKEGQQLVDLSNAPIEKIVRLHDLGIQALDLVYLINRKHESGFSELEARIRHVFLAANNFSDDTIVKIEFASAATGAVPAGVRSFAEILPVCHHIRQLISASRVLGARDYTSQSKELAEQPDNPDNIDANELRLRVQNIFDELTIRFNQLDIAILAAGASPTLITLDALREKLIALSDAGISDAFPQSATGFTDERMQQTSDQAASVSKRFTAFAIAYNTTMTEADQVQTSIERKVQLLTEMAKGMLGADYVLLPLFHFNNPADVSQAYTHKNELLKYAEETLDIPLVVEEWLHGASLVRKKLRNFELLRIMHDTVQEKKIDCSPIQIPYLKNDNWIAVEYPAGMEVVHDTISIVQVLPQGFNPNAAQCELVIDDWTEFIPHKEETTGISFHYDQPNSAPPQTILLAVSPEESGRWTWNHLASTILDTFDRAKQRAVEPDMIDTLPGITTLLPAVVSEFSTGANNVSLDYSFNIKQVFEQAAVLSNAVNLQINKDI